MTWFFFESSAQHHLPQRWRDFEIYVSDSWKLSPRVTLDLGLRYSRLFNVYTADDRILSFQPDPFDPALGADPCNGLLQPPGTGWCQEAGFQGGSDGPNRSLYEEDKNLLAPRRGIAWDVFGTGKTALRAGLGQFFLRERLSPSLELANNPPFTNAQRGLRTLNSGEEPCPGCFFASAGVPQAGRETRALTPNSWQWNLSVEHEIFPDTTLEVSYVGNKGTHLLRNYDVNQVRAGGANGNGVSDRLEYARTAAGDLRPYGVFGDLEFGFWDNGGSSIYHALQTQLVSRFGRGSQFEASYTWSRTIADVTLEAGSEGLLDVDDPRLDRGLPWTHRTHLFNSSLVLLLPSLQGKSGFVKHVLGDWEIGTIVVATSGTPITVVTGNVPGVPGGPSGTNSWGGYQQRPNRVPGEPCRATGGPREQWLNPDAFTLTGFELGTIGDGGRGTCEGPGVFQVDLALSKNIRLSDRVTAQLRFEVFNVFNRVNFLSVDNSMDPISVMLDAPLESATRITGAELPANFGQARSTREPRQAQFGIKLIF